MPVISWAHSQYWAGAGAPPIIIVTPAERKQAPPSEIRFQMPADETRIEIAVGETRTKTVPAS